MLKILGVSVLMVAAAYCQENHHGNTISLKTFVSHEVPKKVERHSYYDLEQEESDNGQIETENSSAIKYNVIPFQNLLQQTTEKSPDLKVQTQFLVPRIPPREPAPVYESQQPVHAPVHLKIVQKWDRYAPAQYRVIQLLHQKPINLKDTKAVPVRQNAPIVIQPANALVKQDIFWNLMAPVREASVSPILQQIYIDQNNAEAAHHIPQHVIEDDDLELNQQNFVKDISDAYYEKSQYINTDRKESSQDQPLRDDYDYDTYPKYDFADEVKDMQTHGTQYQDESRVGDIVKKVYYLQEPNESTRTSNYDSNKRTGFNLDVIHKRHTKKSVIHY